MMPLVVQLVALAGLLVAWRLHRGLQEWPRQASPARTAALAIRRGAAVFLLREYAGLAAAVVAVAGLVGWQLGALPAAAFAGGAVLSGAAGAVGVNTATRANLRTALAAQRGGRAPALRVAVDGGAVMGLTVASLGLIGVGALVALAGTDALALGTWTAFGAGASAVALFARVGGGIFTKCADVGADLVGKVEAGIAEDDPRNPAVITDNVGDNVGDVAGMGADIFESYCGAVIAAVALAVVMPAADAAGLGGREALALMPLAISGCGLAASLAALALMRRAAAERPDRALALGLVAATVLFLAAAAAAIGFAGISGRCWLAVVAGTVGGIAIGIATQYYTKGPPVRRLAGAAETGAAPLVIRGLAVGMTSAAVPVLVIGLAIHAASEAAGLYGVGLAATGMLATTGMVMSIDAYGPIADNAGGIAEMGGLGARTRAVTDELDAVGNTTAAIGKGYAIGAAAMAALGLMSAFVETVRGARPGFVLDIADPVVLLGGFVGALLPFLFAALTMTAVGRSAQEMIVEVRRQFDSIPGLREGRARPDSDRCTAIATDAALKRMVLPGLLALAAPALVGGLAGPAALGGMLGVALPTGVVLALLLANAGGAWDNAKKYIEQGNLGGKGSAAHAAAVIGDTVGDPFKDTAGPALNILVKMLAILSLVLAPLIA